MLAARLGDSGHVVLAASRVDYAAAAVEALTGTGHENHVYELAGDTAFTLSELAAEVSRQSGRAILYKDLPPAQYQGVLEQAGVPGAYAGVLADSDQWASQGALNDTSGDLRRLIGHPTTRLIDMPAFLGDPYLEPGTAIHASDLEAWEKTKVRVSSGDAVILRTGRWARSWRAVTQAGGVRAILEHHRTVLGQRLILPV